MAANLDYREYCLSLKGRECEVCGATDQIVVHHLDGDRANNALENLIPVCRQHHAKIHYGMDGVEDYTEQLPDELIHDIEPTSGRKTLTVTGGAYEALSEVKFDEESWTEFAWRVASVMKESGRQDADLSSADGMDEFAEQVASLTAQRLGERLSNPNK